MPLIVISGIPSSGKSTRANEIKQYFEEQAKEVYIVSEEEQIGKAGFDKNNFYKESSKEKHIRSLLKSEVVRLINSKAVVVLDGSNYIKGYRYELFCASKANKCTQCTVRTVINKDTAWIFNKNRPIDCDKYNKEVFDELIQRYEDPDPNNRWDSPLFLAPLDRDLDLKAISECLFDKKPPPPNQSTQNPPLSATNFLYELDKITKEITDNILRAKNMGTRGEIMIAGYELPLDISDITPSKLMLWRRQYITYSKMHAPDIAKIPQLYVQYLKASTKN